MMTMYLAAGLFPDEERKLMSMDAAIFRILTSAGFHARGFWVATTDKDGDRSIRLRTPGKDAIEVKAETLLHMPADQFLNRLQKIIRNGWTEEERLLERATYFMHHCPPGGYTRKQRAEILELREKFWQHFPVDAVRQGPLYRFMWKPF